MSLTSDAMRSMRAVFSLTRPGRIFTLSEPSVRIICSRPYCCEPFSTRSSKPVCAQCISAALRSALRLVVRDERRLVDRASRTPRLCTGRWVRREPTLGRARRRRRLQLLDEQRAPCRSTIWRARLFGELHQRAVAILAFLVLVLLDEELDPLPDAAARRASGSGTSPPRCEARSDTCRA